MTTDSGTIAIFVFAVGVAGTKLTTEGSEDPLFIDVRNLPLFTVPPFNATRGSLTVITRRSTPATQKIRLVQISLSNLITGCLNLQAR